ncbi:MAG TPA: M24 family metallopeptidase [Pyrinomonadaceae bacterium]|jgi:Xaa-Pro aminopeptidase|nr:M24 family metallopeptidase [Pyrinomonadaceae bacterium]
MRRHHDTRAAFALAALALLLLTSARAHAQDVRPGDEQTGRVAEIQAALREANLDGWLFYDFRRSDPLAYRILKLPTTGVTTRRWFYYVPVVGEPVRVVHSIERYRLDALPGRKIVYRSWQELHAAVRDALASGGLKSRRVVIKNVAMQYSPNNDIPYVARVDAGTVELVRSMPGVSVVTSADLVQQFEATLTPEQLASHREAADKLHKVIMEGFAEIARRIRAGETPTEYEVQRFIARRLAEEGMTAGGGDVSAGANTANPHYFPTAERSAPIRRGDFVLFDISEKLAKPGSIVADQTWVGYVGESVPEEYVKVFNVVRDARDSATEFVRAAVREGRVIRAAQVDDVSRGVIARAGYAEQFTHRTGHSIGEEGHGNGANIDNFETRDSRRVIPRTCFSIEPGIYLEGKFGVRSEINVYVGERDIEVTGRPVQTEIVAILK